MASITSSGVCVPPGPSKKASSLWSAENRFRTAAISRATAAIRATLATACGAGLTCESKLATLGESAGGRAMSESIAVPAEAAAESAAAGQVVEAQELTRRYGEGDTAVDALRGVNLEVGRGKLTAVMGPSGSGKSTLRHILAARDKPTSGYVELAGTRLGELSDTEITKLRRKHIGFVFQFFNLLPMLTAEENVLLPLTIAGEKPEPKWREELIKKVGLADRREHRPAELSGGQQQRVAIARALASRPTVVFADEPTGNLDSATSAEILELVRESVEALAQTMVMVTHDPRAATIADRILFLADGVVVKDLGPSTTRDVIAAMEEVSRS